MSKIVKHIEGCNAYGIDYREWRRQRHFIAADIDCDGSFLDLGCANGFLVRCLEKWSGCRFVPYGVDINPQAIADCAQLFPGKTGHFVCRDVRDFTDDLPPGFPSVFDYVFWNIPNGWSLDEKRRQLASLMQLVAPGGKLLAAVYGSNARGMSASAWDAEGLAVRGVFADLESRGIAFRHVRHNPWGTHHAVGQVRACSQVVEQIGLL